MAKKLKLMSLFQELSGRAVVTNRHAVQPAAGIYLMQLRAHAGATALPRRQIQIEMTLNPAQSQARPVKIRHVAPATVSENAPAPDGANAPAKRLALPQVRSAID
jgi:hypothetical protein